MLDPVDSGTRGIVQAGRPDLSLQCVITNRYRIEEISAASGELICAFNQRLMTFHPERNILKAKQKRISKSTWAALPQHLRTDEGSETTRHGRGTSITPPKELQTFITNDMNIHEYNNINTQNSSFWLVKSISITAALTVVQLICKDLKRNNWSWIF